MENGCARAHVQMQPTLTCVKLVSIGPLVTHKIWTQSSQPLARSGKLVCTLSPARATMHVAGTGQASVPVKYEIYLNGSLDIATKKTARESVDPFPEI